MDLPSALGAPLSADSLARRTSLPKKPAPVELAGDHAILRPLDLDRDLATLHAISCGRAVAIGHRSIGEYDPEAWIWRYMFAGPFADEAAIGAYLAPLVAAPDALPFTVFEPSTGHAVGVACYVANAPEHLKIELGSIWYTPAMHGSGISAAATFLMLAHAFALGYRRVEWKCDAFNERSRRAAARMGFRFEGIQEAHYIVKGRNRDTAWYRVLEGEWPSVEPRLRALF